MQDVSEESLLDYFYNTGGNSGRVKNADILKTFKPFIGHSDLQLRAKYREEFKQIIDRIAVVKSENSESEQDEESNGSMGSASVALDPVEKEWIYSAAGARVPDLSHLLRQDPTLANKKDFTSGTALHWAAKHGNKDMATLVAEAGADVNTKSGYTPLHIAALHGHQHILDLLVGTYELAVTQARERHRNRKLASLFSSKKKWGSAEELAPIEEERSGPHQLPLPPIRPRKFSR
ncbi:hypothetical protein WMY93_017722 [Mugilogobius chulae]|uniref:SOWAHA-C winged helix-turn-helix domain-containing protein n=1 Tax=Mugilogobius chulae TaxID=88201 RepID=A0AAW0NP04_9GOBI